MFEILRESCHCAISAATPSINVQMNSVRFKYYFDVTVSIGKSSALGLGISEPRV